jgi:hypothetical protein
MVLPSLFEIHLMLDFYGEILTYDSIPFASFVHYLSKAALG